MKKLNEENACEAFIEILRKITGKEYKKEDSPDEHSGSVSDVDYILITEDGRSTRIAVEHTIVESFEKQIIYGYQSYEVVKQINDQCQGKLPTDRYYILTVPPTLIKSLKRKWKKRFVEEISSWITNVAKTLTTDQSSSLIYNDHKVTLICGYSHPEVNGNVIRIQEQPLEFEKLMRERFRRAIREKLPKLRKYKIRYILKRISTSLLLEDISGALWDHKARWKDLTIIQRLCIFIFVDYVIILVSKDQKMIVGRVWKEKWRLYSEIPQDRKFSFHHRR